MGMQPQYGNQAGVAQPGNGVFPMATPYNQMNAPIGVQDPFGPVPGTQVREAIFVLNVYRFKDSKLSDDLVLILILFWAMQNGPLQTDTYAW